MNAAERRQIIMEAVERQADKVLEHEIVDYSQRELLMNLHLPAEGLPWFGTGKIAMYAASVATAMAWGISPEIIRFSYPATDDEIARAYETLSKLDVVPTEV